MSSENTILVVEAGDRQVDLLARTHTVGLKGCGFSVDNDLGGVDTMLRVMISVRPSAFETTARIAYQAPRNDGGFDVGVEFLDLGPQERKVIEDLFQTTLPHGPS